MRNLIPFDFEGRRVRVIQRSDEPWFVLADVCRVLELENPRNVTARLDEDEKNTVHIMDGNRGNPNQSIINESGLYSLILTSRKLAAKRFKKWVTSEVLPSIRKTGRYEANRVPVEIMAAAIALSAREVNAWTRYLDTMRCTFNRAVAAAQYPKTPLPALVSSEAFADPVEVPQLNSMACLAHLLALRVSRTSLSLGDLARLAKADAATRNSLGAIGIRIDPINWRGFVAVAVSHPRLQRAFVDTPWMEDWSMALLGIQGAKPAPDLIEGFDKSRRAVLVPWDAVEQALTAMSRGAVAQPASEALVLSHH